MSTEKPQALPLIAENTPQALRDRAQFVLWKYESRGRRWIKVPLNPRNGEHADIKEPQNRATFDIARQAASVMRADGIGFVFTSDDPFAGVDLDKCRDPATDEIEPWARAIIEKLDSYTEVSPSGTGVKIFVRAQLPLARNRTGNIEMYDRDRFFTLTGQRIGGTPVVVEARQDQLAALQRRTFGDDPPPPNDDAPKGNGLTDAAVLRLAMGGPKGEEFAALWLGAWEGNARYPSHSEADLALAGRLVYWTGGDLAQVDRLFRRSGLMRPKWEERHGAATYGAMTIHAALNKAERFYTGKDNDDATPPAFNFLTYDELTFLPPPAWLVEGVLVANSLAAIVGEPASFKSFLALDLALALATGTPWCDRAVTQRPVAYISAEGSGGLPLRMAAWGRARGVDLLAESSFTALPRSVQFLDDADVAALLAALHALPAMPGLIVVDTLARTFVGGEENSARDVGRLIEALDQVRRATGATILLLHHVAKGSGTIRGSTALPGALDTLIEVERKGDHVTVKCRKQKEADDFPRLHFTRRVVDLGYDVTSMVLEEGTEIGVAQPPDGTPVDDGAQPANWSATRLLRVLLEHFSQGAVAKDWRAKTDLSESQFDRYRKELTEQGLVSGGGRKGVPFVVTEHGVNAVPPWQRGEAGQAAVDKSATATAE